MEKLQCIIDEFPGKNMEQYLFNLNSRHGTYQSKPREGRELKQSVFWCRIRLQIKLEMKWWIRR